MFDPYKLEYILPKSAQEDNFNYKPSAVIIPLVYKNNVWNLLLSKRGEDGSIHAKQISFPGGRKEGYDKSLLDAALRETEEEIGIDRNNIHILGYLEKVFTISSNYVIYPFIGVIKTMGVIKLNKSEIEAVFTIPIDFLINSHPFKLETFIYNSKTYKTFLIEYNGETIWGATARILDILMRKIKTQYQNSF